MLSGTHSRTRCPPPITPASRRGERRWCAWHTADIFAVRDMFGSICLASYDHHEWPRLKVLTELFAVARGKVVELDDVN